MNDTKQNATLPKGACQVTCPDCHLTIVHRKATWACCDGRGCLACTGIENALPAEPGIEVAPGEPNQVAIINTTGCIFCGAMDHTGISCPDKGNPVPAVPAQEAPQEPICKYCRHPISPTCDPHNDHDYVHSESGYACCAKGTTFAEPQAGAQVPSQDEQYHETAWCHPQSCGHCTCHNYGDKGGTPHCGTCECLAHLAIIRNYATEAAKTPITREDMHDPLRAQTFWDEAKGFERLVISEIGVSK